MTDATTGATPDAIELLINDHREVEQLFKMMEAARTTGNIDEQRYVAEHVVEDLSVHAVIEEEILYPVMRDALPDGEQLVEEALEEHQEAKELLTRIDGKDPASDDARQAFDELVGSIRHHVQEEESELLPRLREAIGQERLQQMGHQLEMASKAAPTHPHPHAPNTPPGNVAAGAFATVVDKVRDALRSR
ncbi:MAG TPA: hemerythrin domain-containing protein [Acidimicrobiales bacterium]|nr:hemerythrin domain-containing protein [Acidimicrobiales bacterium]